MGSPVQTLLGANISRRFVEFQHCREVEFDIDSTMIDIVSTSYRRRGTISSYSQKRLTDLNIFVTCLQVPSGSVRETQSYEVARSAVPRRLARLVYSVSVQGESTSSAQAHDVISRHITS